MVRFATLAVLFLSATSSVLAARHPSHAAHAAHGRHKRRSSVCKQKATTSAQATATKAPEVVAVSSSSSTSKFVTKTSTSVKASATPDDEDDDDDSTAAGTALFPVSKISKGWTLAANEDVSNAQSVSFTPDTFIQTKKASTSKWDVVQYSGKTAVKAFFNKGSLTPGTQPAGGFSFYTPGPRGSSATVPLLDLTKATELTFSYSIFFQSGFDFNLGGKLPGLYGGVDAEVAATCSGGRHDPDCWSARLMFRPKGAAELYLYIPPDVNDNDNKCGKNANTKCETTYGESVGRGTWTWATGKWQTVSQRILLNTPGKADGEAEIYIDGKSVLKVGKITWRTNAKAVTRGIEMQTFFGGHEAEWASPKDQSFWIADFSVAILQ